MLGRFPPLMRLYSWIRDKCLHLFSLKDRPHAIGLGVALGVFWGFTPFLGFKTLLALGTSRLFRGNVVAAAIAVTLHDLLLPISPVLVLWEYRIGYWLMHQPHQFPNGHVKVGDLLHWSSLFTVGSPLLLGSLIVAIPFGLASYPLTVLFLKRRADRACDSRVGD